ncbi:MAG: hypothetical protein NTW21_41465 [Verrucomicrobia bacterium]|nr:hypothetical protein [Verrucomicrobiota bacterium]
MTNLYTWILAALTTHGLLAAELPPAAALGDSQAAARVPAAIAIRQDATPLEALAANEVRRYIYLRTGKLLEVRRGADLGDRIVVTRKDRAMCGELGQELGPQQFTLKTATVDGTTSRTIVGGDELGTLYGAYRFAEQLGVRFELDGDVVPDAPMTTWPGLDETGKPRFAVRGLQPFHDFSVGPDWWNLSDYQSVLSQMAKLRMNFIGFHTYPSWNRDAGPEANVWIGLPEDVDAQGNVKFGYEAGVVTTRRGWAVTPFPTSKYASGAGLLFENDEYGPDFMLDCLEWPKTGEAGAAMFNRYGDVQQAAFGHARRLGIKTCVGTETPLGVPKLLAEKLEAKGMKADDPATIRRLYEGTFQRLMRKIQPDYYGFCTPEVWLGMQPGCPGWEITTTANVERDLGLAEAAAKSVQASFGMATGGWRLGTREDPMWLDQRVPKSWATSSINTGLGRDPVEKSYGTITGRPKWAITWAEDDETAGAHCCTCWDLQLWTQRVFTDSAEALRYGCDGMMAIHWRTAAIAPNLTAQAQAGWDFVRSGATAAAAADNRKPAMDAFWADWGSGLFGGEAGAEAGRLIQCFDGGHLAINALVNAGANTTDAGIATFFAPLQAMELLRPRIQGTGNLERFDYWLNLVRATQLRVQTWVLAARLQGKIEQANQLAGADAQREFARKEILPLRLDVARHYENLIAALVRCAKSPGEIGTITSIESGCRGRIVSAHDAAIEKLLGTPLPAEAAIRTAYRGEPRIFVSAPCTQMPAAKPLEIRAFVLANSKCDRVTLYCRPLGEGAFQPVPAVHRARQAYRVALPAQSQGTLEYFLEAVLDGGRKVRWPTTAPSINQTVVVW